MASVIGQSIKRREDPRFIQGRGQYAGNVRLPGMLHMAVLRSPFAHAHITRTDGSAAGAMPGVVGVFFGADFEGLQYTGGYIAPNSGGKIPVRPVVAKDTVRFAGEAVAIVVAESRYIAEDALELIEVDYDPLEAAVNARAATDDRAPQLHEGIERNIGMTFRSVAGTDIDEAFNKAAAIARLSFNNNRLVPMPMETRTVVARWDPGTGELTQWATTQNPHVHRTGIAGFFKLPEHKVRILATDVGGGFGAKAPVYPEDVVACSLSMRLERPVKWVETRRENFTSMTHGRDQITEIELAADAEGRLLGLRGTTWGNAGAYLSGFGMGIPSVMHVPLLPGAYHLPALSYTVYGVYTNTNPVDAYRGAGRPEATFAIERMMDTLAAELGVDPAEIRRRNFIQPDEFPATTITGMGYDSGDYDGALQKALDMAGYGALREEQARLRAEGRYLGIGVSSYIECCGFGPSRILKNSPSRGWMLTAGMGGGGSWEAAHVRVSPQGKVWVGVGVSPHGQGEETTFAQIVADTVGCSVEDVEILHGDTLVAPAGRGTGGSRTLVMGGSAVRAGAIKVYEKARAIAAHLLEVAPEDIELANGRYGVRGSPDKGKTWVEVAAAAASGNNLPEGTAPGLEETGTFDPDNYTFPFGSHVCVVEVDPETGEVEVKRYIAVDDCGPLINPMIVEGQVHGGIVQGMAQALWEGVEYDESGQLMTASLLDYAVPKAGMIPPIESAHTVTPSPSNPLGVKGVGEAGTIGATPAVVNAVVDALRPLGVTSIEMPMTPERVWRAIAAAQG